MKMAGCLPLTESLLNRRHFIRAGCLSLLGINLSEYLRAKSLVEATGVNLDKSAKAQSCILVWLEGGPSQVDTWDPKSNSSFKAISTNVPGIQISELLPRTAQHMDKLALIRSVRTEENNHGEGTHYAFTGHRPTAAMQFPSLGAIITKEMGARGQVPPHLAIPGWKQGHYREYLKGAFLGPNYDPMVVGSDPSKKDFQVADLSLPKSLSLERLQHRRSFLNVVDDLYRQRMQAAEKAKIDGFTEQALRMIMTPEVKNAFDLSRGIGKDQRCLRPNQLRSESAPGPQTGGGGKPLHHGIGSQPQRVGHPLGQRRETLKTNDTRTGP